MGSAIKIIIVSGVCHFAAYYVLARLTPYGEKLRQYFILSVAIIAVAVILRSALLAYIATAFFCYNCTRGEDPSSRIALFFGLAFTLSMFEGFALNPGINLGGLSHPRMLSLCILLPMYFSLRPEPAMKKFHGIDWAVILFFIWSVMVDARASNVTSLARTVLWTFFDYIIPYIVIRRFMSNYGLAFTAITFALLSQALVGATEAILKWHVHTDIERVANFADQLNPMYKFRYGLLRAQASYLNPLIFALFANMSFLCAVIFYLKPGLNVPKTYTKLMAYAAIGFSVLGTLSSGSRAGVAGSFLIVVVMLAAMWAIRRKSDPKKILVSGFLVCVILIFSIGGDFIRENFDYRARLFDLGSQVMMEEPIFGVTNPQHDPRLESLKQGEGIVDIVNTYLLIGLQYGFPGLILFIYAIFGGLNRLYFCLRQSSDEKLTIGLFAFASLCILAFNLATTSAFGWSYLWIWLLLAISSNIVARTAAEKKQDRPLLGD